MSPSRWRLLGEQANPQWLLRLHLDPGQADLGDPGLPLFSLLPQHSEVPQIEGARLRVTVSHRQSHGKVLATLLPERTSGQEGAAEGDWLPAEIQGEARLMLPSGKGRVPGRLEWRIRFALHAQWPLLLWQSWLYNPNPFPLTVQRYAPLAVGPEQGRLARKGWADLFPARFRFFRLRGRPLQASTYYNLTERFGSLRLAPEPSPLQAATLSPAEEASLLVGIRDLAPPQGNLLPSPPLFAGVLRAPGHKGALLLLSPQAKDMAWFPQPDAYSPGLRLVFYPRSVLPPQEEWAAPPTLLAWIRPQEAFAALWAALSR